MIKQFLPSWQFYACIPTEEVTYICDRFHSVKRPEKGACTGMGLSICKGIIECHNGRISAESHPGRGTNIKLLLPYEAITPGSYKCRR
jgi:signal transduction histidine kinase